VDRCRAETTVWESVALRRDGDYSLMWFRKRYAVTEELRLGRVRRWLGVARGVAVRSVCARAKWIAARLCAPGIERFGAE